MRMKQITAATMQDALHMARRDLGDEAVLLETRKLSGGRGVTVVFALDEPDADLFGEDDIAFAPPRTQDHPPLAGGQHRMRDAGGVSASPQKPSASEHRTHGASPQQIIIQALQSHAIPQAMREKLLKAAQAQRIPSGNALEAAETILAEALHRELTFNPITTGSSNYPTRALMLVGPHGVGKTSAIAKLATQLTLAKRRVVLISTDIERMGATETMQGLSDILKCELHVINKRALLRELVKQSLGNAWVLIDSFGVNIYEFAQMKALGELAGLQGIEPILTCQAGMDAEEAVELAGVFSFLPIERMILTRTDATRRLSSLFSILHTSGYALANMSSSASPTDACSPLLSLIHI